MPAEIGGIPGNDDFSSGKDKPSSPHGKPFERPTSDHSVSSSGENLGAVPPSVDSGTIARTFYKGVAIPKPEGVYNSPKDWSNITEGKGVIGTHSLPPDSDPNVLFTTLVVSAEDNRTDFDKVTTATADTALPHRMVVAKGVLEHADAEGNLFDHPEINIIYESLLKYPLSNKPDKIFEHGEEIYAKKMERRAIQSSETAAKLPDIETSLQLDSVTQEARDVLAVEAKAAREAKMKETLRADEQKDVRLPVPGSERIRFIDTDPDGAAISSFLEVSTRGRQNEVDLVKVIGASVDDPETGRNVTFYDELRQRLVSKFDGKSESAMKRGEEILQERGISLPAMTEKDSGDSSGVDRKKMAEQGIEDDGLNFSA